ncbi:MAG: hypothetical protein GX256_02090 [Fretibacterium sp.]|nr:hypothetical protein [Fretibacterium sp.]
MTRIYFLDPETGVSLEKPIEIENVKVVGFTGVRGQIIASVREEEEGALERSSQKTLTDTDIIIDTGGSPSAGPEMEPNVPYIRYWREEVLDMGREAD